MFSSSSHHPQWILSARKNWINYRNVWASQLYKHAHSQAMCRSELHRFSLIQNWLNDNAAQAKESFREALLKNSDSSQSSSTSMIAKFCSSFEQDVDWGESSNPKALLYGSCVQGTAQRGGDADFALCFPIRRRVAEGNGNTDRDCFHHHQHPEAVELIEPPRLLQRTVILPTLFKQLGETFPITEGLTSEPQHLHVDRVYHARVPILHFVPKHSIFPLTAKMKKAYPLPPSGEGEFKIFNESETNRTLPRFDVAACSSGCRNSFVLRYYFSQSVTLRVMFLALKRWAKYRAYVIHAKRSSLNSYSLAIMLVYWAQRRELVKILEKEDPSWSFVSSSPLVHAKDAFLNLSHHDNDNSDIHDEESLLQQNIDYDRALSGSGGDGVCLAARLFDFFAFYAEEFDRDSEVVDIRGSAEVGKVTSRAEWKEKVNEQFANRDLRVFGLETDDEGRPISAKNIPTTRNNNSPNKQQEVLSFHHDDNTKEFDIVSRHLYGHDVIAVRDPVEPHSVTRNLDFFMCEALWEEFRMAMNCSEPSQLLGL